MICGGGLSAPGELLASFSISPRCNQFTTFLTVLQRFARFTVSSRKEMFDSLLRPVYISATHSSSNFGSFVVNGAVAYYMYVDNYLERQCSCCCYCTVFTVHHRSYTLIPHMIGSHSRCYRCESFLFLGT